MDEIYPYLAHEEEDCQIIAVSPFRYRLMHRRASGEWKQVQWFQCLEGAYHYFEEEFADWGGTGPH